MINCLIRRDFNLRVPEEIPSKFQCPKLEEFASGVGQDTDGAVEGGLGGGGPQNVAASPSNLNIVFCRSLQRLSGSFGLIHYSQSGPDNHVERQLDIL